tara:strand:+ start:14110 stop:14826 length:717 start_codon:yes stop_codon:yes gene_type:complete
MEIKNFIETNYSDKSHGKYLLYIEFEKFFKSTNLTKEVNVGVLGGSHDQPELDILKNLGYVLNTKTLGIENNNEYFDLNIHNKNEIKNFDIIICTQVLEHIWNHDAFFSNISDLAKKGCILYLDCPKSNKAHMEPHYYSSGFTSKYLSKNLKNKGFEILVENEVGSEVLYKSIHITQSWYSKNDIESRYRFNKNNYFFKIKHLIKLSNLGQYLVLKRNLDRETSNFKTMSFVIAKKID